MPQPISAGPSWPWRRRLDTTGRRFDHSAQLPNLFEASGKVRAVVGAALLFVFLALLMAFALVVQGTVDQGAARHRADARHADATWRCNTLRGAGASANCLAQLGPVR